MSRIPLKLRTFFICLYLATLSTLIIFTGTKYLPVQLTSLKNIIFFAFLIALTETFTLAFREISFSTTFAVTIASYILLGPLNTLIVSLLGFSFRVLKYENKYKHIFNTPWYGTLFNYCVIALSTLFGNYFYLLAGGTLDGNLTFNNIPQILIFCIGFIITNTLIISIMFSIHNKKNILFSFFTNVRLVILSTFTMAPFGYILAIVYKQYHYLGILLFIFPVILARYTFSLYVEAKSQYVDTVDALMRAMEARDKYTEGHSQRVAELVNEIAKELKYNDWQIEKLNIASLLHDVGKLGIDDHILNKPGKLTEEEFNIIKSHPEIGYGILKDVKNLKEVVDIVRHHHERFDGKGYPQGKKSEELSLDVFIVQLADSIDAMATDRPYRKALTKEQIIDEVNKNSGTQFHPKVVDAYLNLLKKQDKAV